MASNAIGATATYDAGASATDTSGTATIYDAVAAVSGTIPYGCCSISPIS